ncbi:MAG: phosphoribosyl-AMP cyclohydrolase, partial [Gordonia sp. (in: high G+C Gram-positive bacteria)]
MALPAQLAASLKRNDDGLFAAIAQERSTGIVLMMA